jgi:hypothetical protein
MVSSRLRMNGRPGRWAAAAVAVSVSLAACASDVSRSIATAPTADVDPRSVSLVGDSLAWEAQDQLAEVLGPDYVVDFATFGGWAPCDALAFLDAIASKRPSNVLVSFSGNTVSACMQDPKPADRFDLLRRYRDDLATLRDAVPGARFVLVLQPPMPDPQSAVVNLNEMYRQLATELPNTAVVDGAELLRSADGSWSERLPCLPVDGPDQGCRDGAITVRSPDGSHFCPTAAAPVNGVIESCQSWSSGAFRFAYAMAGAIRPN